MASAPSHSSPVDLLVGRAPRGACTGTKGCVRFGNGSEAREGPAEDLCDWPGCLS